MVGWVPLQVRFFMHAIGAHLRANQDECAEFKQPFLAYRPLWTRDIGEAMEAFLVDNAPAPEEADPASGDEGDGPAPSKQKAAAAGEARAEPPLALFDKQVAYYKEQSVLIGTLPGSANKGWLRVDAKPVRQALSTWVTKWMFAFTQYLLESVEGSLGELDSFMGDINSGLEKEVDA